MAELLGVVSAGAGLASLSIQLLESARKLRKIYQTARGAPEALEGLTLGIETFGLLLREVERDRQKYDVADGDLLARCVLLCQQAVAKIETLVEKLERMVGKTRLVGRIRFAVEEKEVVLLCGELERAKSSLGLAYQLYVASRRASHEEKMIERVDALQSMLTQSSISLHQDVAGHADRPVSTGLQDTRKSNVQRQRTRMLSKPRYSLQLHPWFFSKIWHFSLHHATSGWTAHMRISNTLPADSPVWSLCEKGDTFGLRKMIECGEASPLDYDEFGGSVIEFAICNSNMDVWCLLLSYLDPLGMGTRLIGYGALESGLHDAPERYYHTLFNILGLDATDVLGGRTSSDRLLSCCPNMQSLKIVQSGLPYQYNNLPWKERLHYATQMMFSTFDMFLQALGPFSFAEIARAPDAGYLTHKLYCRYISSRDPSWNEFMVSLIKAGMGLHSEDWCLKTALMILLDCSKAVDIYDRMHTWLDLLIAADVDLLQYGAKESGILRGCTTRSGPNKVSFVIEELKFGSSSGDWDILGYLIRDVPVQKLAIIPGTWVSGYSIPLKIPTELGCWEELVPLSTQSIWSQDTLTLRSSSTLASHLARPWWKLDLDARGKLLSRRHTDDTTLTVLLSRSSRYRPGPRHRSSSMPPDVRWSYDYDLDSARFHYEEHAWLRGLHRCRRTTQWRLGGQYNGTSFHMRYRVYEDLRERYCMSGQCGLNEEGLGQLPFLRELENSTRGRNMRKARYWV